MKLRVAICGSSISGKSTLCSSLRDLTIRNSTLTTSSIDFVKISDSSAKVEGFHLVILMFDLTDRDSLDETLAIAKRSNLGPTLLIGNKTDLHIHRAVDPIVALHFAKSLGFFYREISSLSMKEVEEVKEIIEDILAAHTSGLGKCKLCISPATYRRLKTMNKWLSLTTMLQGVTLLSYGCLIFLSLPEEEQWVGDFLMFMGTLNFMLAFLGFFGSIMKSTRNDYKSIVRPRQYLVIVCLSALYKSFNLASVYLRGPQFNFTQDNNIVSEEVLHYIMVYSLMDDVTYIQTVVIVFNFLERRASHYLHFTVALPTG